MIPVRAGPNVGTFIMATTHSYLNICNKQSYLITLKFPFSIYFKFKMFVLEHINYQPIKFFQVNLFFFTFSTSLLFCYYNDIYKGDQLDCISD